jgi:hypothetical protein
MKFLVIIQKCFIVTLFICACNMVSCQDSSVINRTEGWQSDIDFLLQQIQKQHCVYKSRPLPAKLIAQAAELKKQIDNFSDERILIELERLMYYLGDGHSYILPMGASKFHTFFLPLQFYQFSDGMFIIDAGSAHEKLIGKKVLSIGSLTPAKFMEDMKTYISQDNETGATWIGPFFLRFRGMLESYGLTKGADSVAITLEDESGRQVNKTILFVPVPRLRGIPKLLAPKFVTTVPLYLSKLQDNYWYKEFPAEKTLYVQFNQVMDVPPQTIGQLSLHLDSTLNDKVYEKIIVDVRHNNGGNADLTPPLIRTLKKFETLNPDNRLIIITGRNTFSAAQIFISQLNKETRALFVGEPSSSSPNFVGEENFIRLPWSGATGSISNRYHEIIPGDKRKWIEPDIKINLSSKDFFAGHDPVMEVVLNMK